MAVVRKDWWMRVWEQLYGTEGWQPAAFRAPREAVIVGTKHDDHLVGTDGDDVIDGGKGADTMAGGLGNDVYLVDNAGDLVEEFADGGFDTVRASVSHVLAAEVEQLTLVGKADITGTGNDAANLIEGNRGHNQLDGRAGTDTLAGNAGRDTLDGGTGADELLGGTGDDTYIVDDLGDRTIEQRKGGVDTVVAKVDWTLAAHTEHLLLSGGPSDHLRGIGNALDNLIEGDIGQNYIDGGAGNDTITGGQALSPGWADTLIGGAGDDVITAATSAQGFEGGSLHGGIGNDTLRANTATLYGDEGDDMLYGGPGYGHHASGNTLYGGTGNDTFEGGGQLIGGDGNDVFSTSIGAYVEGGAGDDTLNALGGAGWSSFYVDMGVGNDTAKALAVNNALGLYGGEGDDVLTGTGYNGLLVDGGAGDDTIVASAHHSGQEHTVMGGDGNDHISATGPSGTIEGGAGDDVIISSGLQATLRGGEGDDVLLGYSTRSELEGGAGQDTFTLLAKQILIESTWVTDFAPEEDTLSVSQGALPVGDGDLEVEGATTITGPGGFDTSAELVLLAADIVGPMSMDSIAAALGEANQAYEVGQTSVFVVDNGEEAWVLHFTSSGNDAAISAAELSLIGQVTGNVNMSTDDIVWGP